MRSVAIRCLAVLLAAGAASGTSGAQQTATAVDHVRLRIPRRAADPDARGVSAVFAVPSARRFHHGAAVSVAYDSSANVGTVTVSVARRAGRPALRAAFSHAGRTVATFPTHVALSVELPRRARRAELVAGSLRVALGPGEPSLVPIASFLALVGAERVALVTDAGLTPLDGETREALRDLASRTLPTSLAGSGAD